MAEIINFNESVAAKHLIPRDKNDEIYIKGIVEIKLEYDLTYYDICKILLEKMKNKSAETLDIKKK